MFASENDIKQTFGVVWGPNQIERRMMIFHCDYHCNVLCEHCLITEKIRKENPGRIPDNIADKLIKECAENNLAIYPVSGDPWCWKDYLINFLLPKCEEYNTKRFISTNGIWGNNKNLIEEALKLPLQNLILTVDYYHQKFVPISSINNILDAFKDHPTKVFIASCYSNVHPLSEIKLKYELPFYALPLIHYNNYFDDNKNVKGLFYRKDYKGEIVECRTGMHFVNDFEGNIYRECASFLRGFPCKVGNIMESSMKELIERKNKMRLKFKLYGNFDVTAPHTDACVLGQQQGLIKNFFEDKTYTIKQG